MDIEKRSENLSLSNDDEGNNEQQQQQQLVYSDHARLDLNELASREDIASTVKNLKLADPNIDDKDGILLKNFTTLKSLFISGNKITGVTLAALPTSLEELRIFMGVNISDKDVRKLRHLTNLKRLLVIGAINLNGSAFEDLPSGLEELEVMYCHITDAGIGKLNHLRKLKRLTIAETGVDPEVHTKLDNFQTTSITGTTFNQLPASLEELVLNRTDRLTDASLRKLSHLTKLKKFLFIGSADTNITGATLSELPPSLEELMMIDCDKLVDSNLASLKQLKNLKMLNLGLHAFTTPQTRLLILEALPKLKGNF